jgi:hypothetical protein
MGQGGHTKISWLSINFRPSSLYLLHHVPSLGKMGHPGIKKIINWSYPNSMFIVNYQNHWTSNNLKESDLNLIEESNCQLFCQPNGKQV